MTRLVLLGVLILAGCSSTPPTKIGADTYYSAATNSGGAFGNPAAVAGGLMTDGNKFCAGMGKQFELVTQSVEAPAFARTLGGASITFKCASPATQ